MAMNEVMMNMLKATARVDIWYWDSATRTKKALQEKVTAEAMTMVEPRSEEEEGVEVWESVVGSDGMDV